MTRQLGYHVAPPAFYLKIFLVFLGVLGCWKAYRRQLLLFVSLFLIPLVLFVVSFHSALYLPADTKFIFWVPVFILLMARGATAVSDFLGSFLSRLAGFRAAMAFRHGVFLSFCLLFVFLETFSLRDYYLQMWRIRALPEDRKVVRFLERDIRDEEVIIYDDFLNKSVYLVAKALYSPCGRKIGVMKIEHDDFWFADFRNHSMGLRVILDMAFLSDEAKAQTAESFPGIEAASLSGKCLLSFNDPGQTLIEKLEKAVEFLILLPLA